MTNEQKIEANRVAKTPPGFGVNKNILQVLHHVEWIDADRKHCEALVPRGMPVASNLKLYYWAERETFAGLLAAVKKAGAKLDQFAIINEQKQVIAISRVAADVDADDLAWLSCFFMETMEGQLGFVTSEDIERSNIKNSYRAYLPIGEVAP